MQLEILNEGLCLTRNDAMDTLTRPAFKLERENLLGPRCRHCRRPEVFQLDTLLQSNHAEQQAYPITLE